MLTAAYLTNRTSYSALNTGTLYKVLHGMEATLQHLRFSSSRAFVQIEMHTKNLQGRSSGSRLYGYIQDTKAYRIHSATTYKVCRAGTSCSTRRCRRDGVTTDQRDGQHRRDG